MCLGSWLHASDISRDIAFHEMVRIGINLNVTLPLKRALRLCSETGEETVVRFSYERLSNFSYLCGKLGQISRFCDLRFGDQFSDPGSHMPYGAWLHASGPSRLFVAVLLCLVIFSSLPVAVRVLRRREILGCGQDRYLRNNCHRFRNSYLQRLISRSPLPVPTAPSRYWAPGEDERLSGKVDCPTHLGHSNFFASGPLQPSVKLGPTLSGAPMHPATHCDPILKGPHLHLIDESSSSRLANELSTPSIADSNFLSLELTRRPLKGVAIDLESGSAFPSLSQKDLILSKLSLVDVPVVDVSPEVLGPTSGRGFGGRGRRGRSRGRSMVLMVRATPGVIDVCGRILCIVALIGQWLVMRGMNYFLLQEC
ncbi:hypothetical protein Salat_1149000 [Sesamum alatum]|uniref:Zinc knuckle CX2CX4HX4C domain-containing protein n=1 Tax=Sesamum alatum TaxID=300844 RepID=A0AAE2CNL4_9LAMI|nr:hypothetical protein Salat_1149000 [Sesamum alatum]